MGGIVIGSRSRRRGNQRPVADQFFHPGLPSTRDPQFRRLRARAQQRDLVDRQRLAGDCRRRFRRVMCSGLITSSSASARRFSQIILAVFVHQEPDGAAVHPVDRFVQWTDVVQGLQHEPVTTQCDDHVGVLGRGLAIAGDETLQRFPLRRAHRSRGKIWRSRGAFCG